VVEAGAGVAVGWWVVNGVGDGGARDGGGVHDGGGVLFGHDGGHGGQTVLGHGPS
jgi:hypothetical protein